MIWLIAVCAGGVGAGMWIIARAWFPPARPLSVLSAELTTPRSTMALPHTTGPRGLWHRLAGRLVEGTSRTQQADMAVVGTTPLRHALDKIGYATVFATIGAVPVALFPLLQLGPTAGFTLFGVVLLGAVGWIYPDLALRTKARGERQAWDGAITVFVDVIGISLAGGAGVDDALMDAARAGDGRQLTALAATLHAAQTRRRKLWSALEDLGTSYDLPQLRELAAAMDLAGESGSRVRETLRAKATALRVRQLTDAEADAQRASETMSIAPALMAIAAIVLIAYPAVSRFFQ
ncbi:hypothetical protein BH20ACT4_BH20ACT4_05670 [soil metagenome]